MQTPNGIQTIMNAPNASQQTIMAPQQQIQQQQQQQQPQQQQQQQQQSTQNSSSGNSSNKTDNSNKPSTPQTQVVTVSANGGQVATNPSTSQASVPTLVQGSVATPGTSNMFSQMPTLVPIGTNYINAGNGQIFPMTQTSSGQNIIMTSMPSQSSTTTTSTATVSTASSQQQSSNIVHGIQVAPQQLLRALPTQAIQGGQTLQLAAGQGQIFQQNQFLQALNMSNLQPQQNVQTIQVPSIQGLQNMQS